MESSVRPPRLIRFGVFEVDPEAGELRKQGLKIKLQEQPFQVLALLLEQPGRVVTREELQNKLWSTETFVDFEHGVNTAISKIREALGDSAENPRFVETLPRRGYRFIYPVEVGEHPRGAPALSEVPREGRKGPPLPKRWAIPIGVFSLFAVVGLLVALNVGGLRDRMMSLVGASVSRRMPLPKIESIAVLPLENLSHDPEQEYFADGMTEALTAELAKIGALRVISRTSAMHYKGTKRHLTDIARELNVDAVVEGSVMRSGNKVRITAQLIQAATDRHLWAENYERDLGEVVTLQGEVARAIAQGVKIKLTPMEQIQLSRTRPVNPEAHELYLKGRFYCDQRTEDRLKKGIDYFRRAIARDPTDGLAYAGLADCTMFLAVFDIAPPKEVIPQAKEAIAKALALDKSLPEAHASLAMVTFLYDRDWLTAEKEFKLAIELSPSYVTGGGIGYPLYLLAMGRKEEAIAEAKRAHALDPVGHLTNAAFGYLLFLAHQYDEAIEQNRKTLELFPDSVLVPIHLVDVYEQKGQFQEALKEYQRAEGLSGTTTKTAAELRRAYLKAGVKGYWQSKLELLRAEAKRRYVPPYFFAIAYASLGDKDRALDWLEKEYQEGHDGLVFLKVDPHFDGLRSDPRFQDLVRRMNFPP